MIPREKFTAAYSRVPYPIREFLADEEFPIIVEEIAKATKLHIDATGTLSDTISETLLGLISPQELPGVLTQRLGVDQSTVTSIITAVNERIFTPLQKRVREYKPDEEESVEEVQEKDQHLGERAEKIVPSVTAQPERAPVPIYSPLPIQAPSAPPARIAPQPPKQVPPPANLPGQPPEPPTPRPMPPAPPHIELPTPPPGPIAPPIPTPSTETPKNNSQAQVLHTMAKDMQALKSGMDPYRVAHPAPPAWAAAPTAIAQTSPTPARLPPKQPLVTVPPVQTKVVPAQPNPAPTLPPQQPLTVHLKQYGVDPYREPVE